MLITKSLCHSVVDSLTFVMPDFLGIRRVVTLLLFVRILKVLSTL